MYPYRITHILVIGVTYQPHADLDSRFVLREGDLVHPCQGDVNTSRAGEPGVGNVTAALQGEGSLMFGDETDLFWKSSARIP